MNEEKVMVCRPQSFKPYWARSLSFGPMSREEAKKMGQSPFGQQDVILTMEKWREAHLRGEVE